MQIVVEEIEEELLPQHIYAHDRTLQKYGMHFQFITKDSPTEALKFKDIKIGDIIFADWNSDSTINHSMIVTEKLNNSYDGIKVSYQNAVENDVEFENRLDYSLKTVNKFPQTMIFYVYRPTFYSDASNNSYFRDIPSTSEYYYPINYLEQNNIITGYSSGNFESTWEISRQELLKMVLRTAYEEITPKEKGSTAYFEDLGNSWAIPYINYAREHKFIKDNPTFRPTDKISYAETAKIVVNVLIGKMESTSTPWSDNFYDKLYEYGIDKNFFSNISGNINRAEVSYLIYKVCHSNKSNSCRF